MSAQLSGPNGPGAGPAGAAVTDMGGDIDLGIRRGYIYVVDYEAPGTGQRKRRPALVVQNDLGNTSGATTIVVGLSSQVPSRLYPFHVPLPGEVLGREGIVMCEHVFTVEIERLDPQPLAQCPPEVLAQVEQALMHSLGMSVETAVILS